MKPLHVSAWKLTLFKKGIMSMKVIIFYSSKCLYAKHGSQLAFCSLSYNIGQSGTEKNEAVNCTNLISRRRYIFSLCIQGDL
jgi:hypothetical protein